MGTKFSSFSTGIVYHINHAFDCDSEGVTYLITCKTCHLQYVSYTVTPFRQRFNNHKSSLLRFGKGQRGVCWQGLYSHFFEQRHKRLENLRVQIIDVIDINKSNERENYMSKLRIEKGIFLTKGLCLETYDSIRYTFYFDY